jgi:hypothetical protein
MSSGIAQKADNLSVRTHLARKGIGVPASAEMTSIRHPSRTRDCQADPAARDRRYKGDAKSGHLWKTSMF